MSTYGSFNFRLDDNRLPKNKIKLQTSRENKYRKTTNETGKGFQGGRNRPKGPKPQS